MPTKLTGHKQIIAEKTVLILLVRGEDPYGHPIYAYVGVRADRVPAFMEAQQNGTFYPEDHGVVIESGSGEPPTAVKKRMETDYGFNHQTMIDIPDTDKAYDLANNVRKLLPEKDE